MRPGKSQAVVLSGREFSAREVEQVQETVGVFSTLSRFELAQTLCEHLGWVTAKGQYKVDACLKALRQLEQWGQIELPRVQACRVRQAKPLGCGEPTDPGQPEVGSVEDFEPVELQAATPSPRMKLWNQYVGRYHYLGYQRPFGAHQR